MKEKIKILLGEEDVFPKKNKDIFLNIELSRESDELVNEIINNNFNLKEQFLSERDKSLKFCVYGIFESLYADTNNVEISIRTNHNDLISSPRISSSVVPAKDYKIKSFRLSSNGNLSKNIFSKEKSSYYFLFELSPFYKRGGENKEIILDIRDDQKRLFASIVVPFLFFNEEGNRIPYGTSTVETDLEGNETIVENDYKFLYDTHWVKADLNLFRPLKLSFINSLDDEFLLNQQSLPTNDKIFLTPLETIKEISESINPFQKNQQIKSKGLSSASIDESFGKYEFFVKLDFPSIYGIEETWVNIVKDNTIKNPERDYIFKPQKLTWSKNEQYKKVEIELIDDLYVESIESLEFGFTGVRRADISETNSRFTLNIEDKDKPIPIGFSTASQRVIESGMTITIDVFLDKPMNVPNQTIDVYVDSEASSAIVNQDYMQTDTVELSATTKSFTATGVIPRTKIGGLPGYNPSGIERGSKFERLDGGNFVSDGFKVGDKLTYSSEYLEGVRKGQAINSNLILEIKKVETHTLTFKTPTGYSEAVSLTKRKNQKVKAEFIFDVPARGVGKWEKTLNLKKGVSTASFEIELLNDFQYELEKNIILKFRNPSQNVTIGNLNQHEIIIEDNMIPLYTRYVFPGDESKGHGIFKMNKNFVTTPSVLKLQLDDGPPTPLSGGGGKIRSFTKDLNYIITVINKGEPIVSTINQVINEGDLEDDEIANSTTRLQFESEKGSDIIPTDGIVGTFNVKGGFSNFIIDLQSNFQISKRNRQFKKCLYEFILETENYPLSSIPIGAGPSSNVNDERKARTFEPMTIPAKPLKSGVLKGQSKFFLTSIINTSENRIKGNAILKPANQIYSNSDPSLPPYPSGVYPNTPILFGYNYECKDEIQNKFNRDVKMNGTLFLNQHFTEENINIGSGVFGFGGGNNQNTPRTKVVDIEFKRNLIKYTICTGATNDAFNSILLPIEPISGTTQ